MPGLWGPGLGTGRLRSDCLLKCCLVLVVRGKGKSAVGLCRSHSPLALGMPVKPQPHFWVVLAIVMVMVMVMVNSCRCGCWGQVLGLPLSA